MIKIVIILYNYFGMISSIKYSINLIYDFTTLFNFYIQFYYLILLLSFIT